MNEKQAKLLRYFVKHTGQIKMAAAFKIGFDKLNHKKKGKLTKWLKTTIVTAMALQEHERKQHLAQNLKTLEGFTV